jgi:hypothetical protein
MPPFVGRATKTCLDAAVKVIPVLPKINSPKYDEPDCIEALVA